MNTARSLAEETSERIIAAAVTILDAEGLEAVTMRRVARESHTSVPGLYYHFEGREGLVRELYLRITRDYVGAVMEQLHELNTAGADFNTSDVLAAVTREYFGVKPHREGLIFSSELVDAELFNSVWLPVLRHIWPEVDFAVLDLRKVARFLTHLYWGFRVVAHDLEGCAEVYRRGLDYARDALPYITASSKDRASSLC